MVLKDQPIRPAGWVIMWTIVFGAEDYVERLYAVENVFVYVFLSFYVSESGNCGIR